MIVEELFGVSRPGHVDRLPTVGLERITNRVYWKNMDIARYGRWLKKLDFLHYTAFGRVWYGAKYSHRVWEQFAHTFEKYFVLLKPRSVNYFFSGLSAVNCRIYEGICYH